MSVKTELLGLASDADPYPGYARLRQEEPVCRVKLRDGLHCWLISRYGDARAALADPRLSRDPRLAVPQWRESDRGRRLEDGSGLGVHLPTREPPDHTRLRRLVASAFVPRRVERMRGRVREVTGSLIDAFQARGRPSSLASSPIRWRSP